ncbi:FUSC family protein [Alcaligenes sp. GCM10023179]|uniref:FUSC family protein n=1 Tax=Alcaligenes sp. GCM10023179 TaxID=3252633 RepID=UPI00361D4A66
MSSASPSPQSASGLKAFLGRMGLALSSVDITSPRAGYILRSILAAWLALSVAYLLDLHAPFSAASSVLLVINPVQGAVIGKGTWRVLGTLVGMLAAFVLMSAFGQQPWLFLLGFAFWLGLCVMAMGLLRHYKSYGAALAGYTVGLAVYGAMGQAQLSFDHVVGRGSSVLVGVLCLGVVSALFSTRSVRSRLQAQLLRLASETARVLAGRQAALHACRTAESDQERVRHQLMMDVYGADDLLSVGKAESADLAARATALRHAIACLFSAMLGGAGPLPQTLTPMPVLAALRQEWEQAWKQAAQLVSQGPDGLERARAVLMPLRARLQEILNTGPLERLAEPAPFLIAGDRLIEQLDDYLAALDSLRALYRLPTKSTYPAIPFYRDISLALENGVRAMLTVLLGGTFWILTGWTDGNMMLAGLAAACALLSPAPNPPAAAMAFIKGIALSIVAAFLCTFVVLPLIEGLPLLLIVLALFWLPAIYATTVPKYAMVGVAYLVSFTTLAAPSNPMHYDFELFVNGSVAWLLCTFFTLLGFQLFWPRKLSRDLSRLQMRIRANSLAVLRGKRFQPQIWRWRQQHRLAQLGAGLKAQPAQMQQALSQALDSVHLGWELLRLQSYVRQTQVPAHVSQPLKTTLRHMARRADRPRLAARHARRLAQAVQCRDAEPQHDGLRLAAVLLDIAMLLERHPVSVSLQSGSAVHA